MLHANGSATLGLSTGYPGGFALDGTRIIAQIDVGTLDGAWRDTAGRHGSFVPVGTPTNPGRQRGDVPSSFLHVVSPANRPTGGADNVTCFSHALTNGNPDAVVLVTRNRGAQSGIRPLVPSLVSLYYDDDGTGLPGELSNNVWCLSRDDSQAMPLGAGFNISVPPR